MIGLNLGDQFEMDFSWIKLPEIPIKILERVTGIEPATFSLGS
jgi:hypothetical protein